MTQTLGDCFCGAVEVTVTGEPAAEGFCHCSSCQVGRPRRSAHLPSGPGRKITRAGAAALPQDGEELPQILQGLRRSPADGPSAVGTRRRVPA
jgi:hypothetical protein